LLVGVEVTANRDIARFQKVTEGGHLARVASLACTSMRECSRRRLVRLAPPGAVAQHLACAQSSLRLGA
jgi:hypothetical protein